MLDQAPVTFQALDSWQPGPIDSVEDTGLSQGTLSDLALKIMYIRGQITGYDIADHMKLPFRTAVQPILEFLKREHLCEVKGSAGVAEGTYLYTITDKGSARAREQFDRTTYADAAPVTWDDYIAAIQAQGSRRLQVNPHMMHQAMSHLVLNERVFSKIGPAVNSGKSIFLYGPPGNGKTTIAESVGRMVLGNDMYIPYAVEVDGQIIKVYDEINHVVVPDPRSTGTTGTLGLGAGRRDSRWLRIRRPVIMVGGELTMDGLDLVYDPNSRFYEAPYQMKANGGMFLIDDFGRQQIRPRDLLNRWIVPMEKNVDYLALRTGRKLEIPFAVLLVFSTNLPPADLVDEAFLRRIRHKIKIVSPTYEEYREIFRRVCDQYDIPYESQAVRYLLQEHYVKKSRLLRGNHPRDIVEQLIDIGSYRGVEPRLTKDMLDQASESYFVDL